MLDSERKYIYGLLIYLGDKEAPDSLVDSLGNIGFIWIRSTGQIEKAIIPNVKMKDSGIKWLGKIPENWNFNKIKRIAKTKSG